MKTEGKATSTQVDELLNQASPTGASKDKKVERKKAKERFKAFKKLMRMLGLAYVPMFPDETTDKKAKKRYY